MSQVTPEEFNRAGNMEELLGLLGRAGIEAMGLELLVAEHERLPQLNAIKVPAGVDEALVRKRTEILAASTGTRALPESADVNSRQGDLADQAIEAGRIGIRGIAMAHHGCTVLVIGGVLQ